jgi:hypothetical protein
MSHSPPRFNIQPQRRIPGKGGWFSCPTHQAQRFAVIEVKPRRKGCAAFTKVIVAHPTYAEANDALVGLMRKHARGRKFPKPGSRWDDRLKGRGEPIVVGNFTHNPGDLGMEFE